MNIRACNTARVCPITACDPSLVEFVKPLIRVLNYASTEQVQMHMRREGSRYVNAQVMIPDSPSLVAKRKDRFCGSNCIETVKSEGKSDVAAIEPELHGK